MKLADASQSLRESGLFRPEEIEEMVKKDELRSLNPFVNQVFSVSKNYAENVVKAYRGLNPFVNQVFSVIRIWISLDS